MDDDHDNDHNRFSSGNRPLESPDQEMDHEKDGNELSASWRTRTSRTRKKCIVFVTLNPYRKKRHIHSIDRVQNSS